MPTASERIRSLAAPSRSGSEMVAPAVRSSNTSPRSRPSACSNICTRRQSMQVTMAMRLRGACPMMGSVFCCMNCSLCAKISSITIRSLFSLTSGIAGLIVKIVEVFDLDEIETCLVDARQQSGDLGMRHGAPIASHETAAPVVGAEGFGHAARPHLRAAIGNHSQFQAIAADLLEGLAQLLGGAAVPVEEDIDAHQRFLFGGMLDHDRFVGGMLGRGGVADGLELLRSHAEA